MYNPPKTLLKDSLCSRALVETIADHISVVYLDFQRQQFIEDAFSAFPSLELKARITHIADMFQKYLPDDYQQSLQILRDSLKGKAESTGFIYIAYCEFVSTYGCEQQHLQLSFDALGQFTAHGSAEFAIRVFLNAFPAEAYAQMKQWSVSTDYHQRRLVSEGIRPTLPWGKNIAMDYRDAVKILDDLYADTERYVTRSVANHLNDVSKKDPALVLEIFQKWKASRKQNSKEMDYMIKHSLRTLIKQGHPGTMQFLGYSLDPSIEVSHLNIKNTSLQLGEALEFSFEVTAQQDESLMIDFIIIFPRLNGKSSAKVFKLKQLQLSSGKTISLSKKHVLKLMTTRKLYTGKHVLKIQINGNVMGGHEFQFQC